MNNPRWRAGWVLGVCLLLMCSARAMGDLYQVLVGEGAREASAYFVGVPDATFKSFDEANELTPVEQRVLLGGVVNLGKMIKQTRGAFAEELVSRTAIDGARTQYRLVVLVENRMRRFTISENQRGEMFLEGPEGGATGERSRICRVHRDRMDEILCSPLVFKCLPNVSDTLPNGIPAPGTVGLLPGPYLCGEMYFDDKAVASGLMLGPSSVAGTNRVLDNERLHIRLPKSYTPEREAGLLVWIDGDTSGTPPAALFEALDAFNIICVGAANSGNDRPLSDRAQLALDAVRTVSSRFQIDQSRVYTSGISGGGRVASMLAIAQPAIFRGCVGVVGLNSFHAPVLPDGKRIAKPMGAPNPKLMQWLRTSRIAAITGDQDFNHDEIVARAALLNKSHVPTRVFDIKGLGHTMPSPKDAMAAIDWLDKERREHSESREAEQLERVDAVLAKVAPGAALSRAQCLDLFANVRARALTPADWKALRRAHPERFTPTEVAKQPAK